MGLSWAQDCTVELLDRVCLEYCLVASAHTVERGSCPQSPQSALLNSSHATLRSQEPKASQSEMAPNTKNALACSSFAGGPVNRTWGSNF